MVCTRLLSWFIKCILIGLESDDFSSIFRRRLPTNEIYAEKFTVKFTPVAAVICHLGPKKKRNVGRNETPIP